MGSILQVVKLRQWEDNYLLKVTEQVILKVKQCDPKKESSFWVQTYFKEGPDIL